MNSIIEFYIIVIETNLLILFNSSSYTKIETYNNILNYLFAMITNATNVEYILAISFLINRYINICRLIEEHDLDLSIRETHLWINMIEYYQNMYYQIINLNTNIILNEISI